MSTKKLNQYQGRLTPAQVAEGINAASRNARRLANDIEEAGKASILRHLSVATSDKEVSNCWREYRSHTRKNVMGGLLDVFARGARKLDDFTRLFSKDAEHPYLLDQLKQLGFYTDCLAAAHWSEPEAVIDEQLAKQLVRTAEILVNSKETSPAEIELWVKHLAPVWNQAPGWMRKALENWYEDMQRHGLAPEGENAMRRFIRDGIPPKNGER
jgi:AbiV family abortive infection protein